MYFSERQVKRGRESAEVGIEVGIQLAAASWPSMILQRSGIPQRWIPEK
jgi:sulfopyruvate decarboxylase TPP-binding subunit